MNAKSFEEEEEANSFEMNSLEQERAHTSAYSFTDASQVYHLRDAEERGDDEHARTTSFEEGLHSLVAESARRTVPYASILALSRRSLQGLQTRFHYCIQEH